jgi:hypothetical protein
MSVFTRTILGLSVGAVLLGVADQASASLIRGKGQAFLRGGDLTDPENNGDPEANVNYNATFTASEEPAFGGGEAAFNVFDNQVGGGNMKWCCGDGNNFPTNPISITATFATPQVIRAFTLTSGNDSPDRDPRVWAIQGSNDGTNFTDIFVQNNTAASVWTDRDQVIEWSAGIDFAEPIAYSNIRFITTATNLTTGARFQLGEIEYFNTVVPEPATVSLLALAGGALLAGRRRRV